MTSPPRKIVPRKVLEKFAVILNANSTKIKRENRIIHCNIIFLKFSLLKLLNDRSKKVKEKMVMNTILKKNKIFAR